MSKETNKHHIFFTRHTWGQGIWKELRDYPYCSVAVPVEPLHGEIHRQIGYIPLPRKLSVEDVLLQLGTLSGYRCIASQDPIEKRLMLLAALFDYIEPETSEALKRQLDLVREFNKKAPK